MEDFSKTKLLEFLDFLKNKGLMNGATVAARKAAVNTFLGILTDEEVADVRKLNLDAVALRFSNLKGSDFKPESIRVYKSRVSSALEDFKSYKENPLNFKPSIAMAKTPTAPKEKPVAKSATTTTNPNDAHIVADNSGVVFPVPIRPNLVVKIMGLPSDLTKKEATRIANVVLALAAVGDVAD